MMPQMRGAEKGGKTVGEADRQHLDDQGRRVTKICSDGIPLSMAVQTIASACSTINIRKVEYQRKLRQQQPVPYC